MKKRFGVSGLVLFIGIVINMYNTKQTTRQAGELLAQLDILEQYTLDVSSKESFNMARENMDKYVELAKKIVPLLKKDNGRPSLIQQVNKRINEFAAEMFDIAFEKERGASNATDAYYKAQHSSLIIDSSIGGNSQKIEGARYLKIYGIEYGDIIRGLRDKFGYSYGAIQLLEQEYGEK